MTTPTDGLRPIHDDDRAIIRAVWLYLVFLLNRTQKGSPLYQTNPSLCVEVNRQGKRLRDALEPICSGSFPALSPLLDLATPANTTAIRNIGESLLYLSEALGRLQVTITYSSSEPAQKSDG